MKVKFRLQNVSKKNEGKKEGKKERKKERKLVTVSSESLWEQKDI